MTDSVYSSSASWQFRTKNVLHAIINFIFPPVCASCGVAGVLFCDECRERLPCFQTPIRPYGKNHQGMPLTYVWTASIFAGSISDIIHKLKYNGQFALASPLVDLMVDVWTHHVMQPFDLVLPVPLHPKREEKRGYNQAALLTVNFCQRLNMTYSLDGIRRVRQTTSQVKLNAVGRKSNLNDAFWADKKIVQGKDVLLIDDVFTTGATLFATADALLMAGARSVSGYCVARAE